MLMIILHKSLVYIDRTYLFVSKDWEVDQKVYETPIVSKTLRYSSNKKENMTHMIVACMKMVFKIPWIHMAQMGTSHAFE